MSGMGRSLFFLCLNDRGGAEISMIRIALGLAARGQNVTLVVYGSEPGLAREFGFEGELVLFPTHRTFRTFVPLVRLLRGRPVTTLISALTHTNLIAIVAARLSRRAINVIVTEHGSAAFRSRWSPLRLAAAVIYPCADHVIAVSHALANWWRDHLPKRVALNAIYNPIVADISPRAMMPPHGWLFEGQAPVVMGIGRLTREKNFQLLIRAFAKVLKQMPSRLIILGEGAERPALQRLIRELNLDASVLMPGFVSESLNWLVYARLLVCPSQREGLGNVIVEALSCGVAVVSTDCPVGPAEILDNGRYGTLTPVDDIEQMAQAIRAALQTTVDRKALQRRASDFSVARCIDGYASLIDNPSRS